MDQNTPKHSDNVVSVASLDDVITMITADLRGQLEDPGKKGHAARMITNCIPEYVRAIETHRALLMHEGTRREDLEGFDKDLHGALFEVPEESVDNLIFSVMSLMGTQLVMLGNMLVTCMSEPEKTCDNCKGRRLALFADVLNGAMKYADLSLNTANKRFASCCTDVPGEEPKQ